MTIKEQLFRELEPMSDAQLQKVLEFVRQLQVKQPEIDEEAWQAYLKSEREREEVYRRLANS